MSAEFDNAYSKEQISEWNKQFLENLQTILSNEDLIHVAIVEREAIKRHGSKLKKEDLVTFLSDLQSNNIDAYSIDFNRFHGTLKTIGFTESDFEPMPTIKKIVLCSAVFAAIGNLKIAEQNFNLVEKGADPNLIFSMDVQQELMDNLHREALPIAKRFIQGNGLLLENTSNKTMDDVQQEELPITNQFVQNNDNIPENTSNKTSILPRVLGGLLIAVGIVVTLTPLLLVSQIVGATIALGGIFLFANSFVNSSQKIETKKMDTNPSEKVATPSSEDDLDNNVSMTLSLGVKKPQTEAVPSPQQKNNSVKGKLNSLPNNDTPGVEPEPELQSEVHNNSFH